MSVSRNSYPVPIEVANVNDVKTELGIEKVVENQASTPSSNKTPLSLSTRSSSNTLASPDYATTVTRGLEKSTQRQLSPLIKYTLLFIFCLAQILDTYNASSLFAAIPTLVEVLHMKQSDSVWLISGYQLTFSAFLLISGRISDLYSAKLSFIAGVASLAIFSLIIGFIEREIPFLVLRALTGVGAAFTIPSALTLLVKTFPEPAEQARAIAVLGGCSGVANIVGLILGAIFTQFASWKWVFWFVTIVAAPVMFAGILLIPEDEKNDSIKKKSPKDKLKSLDVVGVTVLTAALILFIYALTSGSSTGWGKGGVIAPLIISIILIPIFLWWEQRTETRNPGGACIPPQTWRYTNFTPLFFTALLPFFWWMTSFTIFTSYWQDVVGWTVITTVVHMIPIGVLAFLTSFTAAPLSKRFHTKYLLLFAMTLLIIATILLMFANESVSNKYWRFTFPAFIIGSGGAMGVFGQTNIAIFSTTPPAIAGIVGAIFNAALQLGAAIGLAIVGSIESSILQKTISSHGLSSTKVPSEDAFSGDRAAYEFLIGAVALEMLVVLVFYRIGSKTGTGTGKGNRDEEESVDVKEAWELEDSDVKVVEKDENSESRLDEKVLINENSNIMDAVDIIEIK